MRFIPTSVHGAMDYLFGVLLIAAPWLLDFNNDGPAMWVPIILGMSMIVYSFLTDYELGVVRVIPMRYHLMLDAAGGIFLALSPWIFGFADFVWIPHVVVGVLEVGAALMTRLAPNPRMVHRTPPPVHS